MLNWSRALWRNKNKLFGLLAVMAIVLAAVWFYGGDRPAPEPEPKTKLEAMQQANSAAEPSPGQLESSGDAGGDASADSAGPTEAGAEESGTAASGEAGSPQPAVPGQEEPSSSLPAGNTEEKPFSGNGDSGASGSAAALEAGAKDGESSLTVPQTAPLPKAGKQTGDDDKKTDTAAEAQPPSGSGSEAATSSPLPGAATKPGKDKESAKEAEAGSGDAVTLTIVGSPDIGTIMETIEVDIGDSKTVLDVLKKAARSQKMQMEYTGSGATAYVQGIDNLYEFDKGSGSGWMYSVNGKFPNRSAGVWPLSSGDDIRWLYTEDLGKDLGAGTDDGLWDGKS